jgi:hypothetical protein
VAVNQLKINIVQEFFLILLFFLSHNFHVSFFSKLQALTPLEQVKDVSFLAHPLNSNCFEISNKMNMT